MLYGKRRRFCAEYVRDYDARLAAVRAGYAGASHAEAGRLLNDPEIAGEIERIVARMSAYATCTLADLVREAEKIAFSDPAEFIRLDNAGAPRLDFSEASPEVLASIAGVEVKEYMEGRGEDAEPAIAIKIKMASRLEAIKLLAALKKFDGEPTPVPTTSTADPATLSPEGAAAEYARLIRS